MDNLNPAEIFALSKLVSSKEASEVSAQLEEGTHFVDFTIRVSGDLKKGADYDQRVVATANPWLLLGAALSHLNGVTVESLVREALTDDLALVKSLKKEAADAINAIKAPTRKVCNGKVTGKVAAIVA